MGRLGALALTRGGFGADAQRVAHRAVRATRAASVAALGGRTHDAWRYLAIIDDGPGIPPERAQEVLRRGGRLDQSGSAGLGLAIVGDIGDIAEAWGASLSIEAPARGCRIVLRIPNARFAAT